ncbi:exonuclease I [Candidatus Liberibacter solanacearum CLso-ZC1]|uniref:Exodeoxyribonuclease I n=1 Tax=Liberibacter solanacearum (strain CLso-ZC1) TaxID=658172 RepID=E4UCR5_LIBSC|nr:exodeoxyribonuclease I [Candidatus Liberibacter solanacearum]ADR52156.1 exonuclease I [Candidatus Liberibacter solanacearum CLso-ZC1]
MDHFVIYDYETFGLDVARDRPAQFAGIRIDHQLETIQSKEVFFCKPSDDYLVDPESVLITGITPQKALRDGVVEHEFAQRVYQFFCKPNTCIFGYNNIRFDDKYSQNIFYRNFYDPYGWSYKNGNSRWDLINVMRAIYAFSPDGIQWPHRDDGFPSFKLQDLALANGIEYVNAHDAEQDVDATLALARLVRREKPKLFNYLYNSRNKMHLKSLIDIRNLTPLVHVSSKFGAAQANTALIAPIAWHPRNANEIIACNLSGDMQVLQDLDSIELGKRLFTRHDQLNGLSPVPLKSVHINRCPVLFPIGSFHSKKFERLGIDDKRCVDNLKLLRQQVDLQEKVIAIYDKPFVSLSEDVDSRLYDGFLSDEDCKMRDCIPLTEPEKLSTLNFQFTDQRLPELLFRYRARNFPHTLDSKEKQAWLEHRKAIFTRSRIEEYENKLHTLLNAYKSNEREERLVQLLFDYLQLIVPKVYA